MSNIVKFRRKDMDQRAAENRDRVVKALELAKSLQSLDEIVCDISAGEITAKEAWTLKDGSDISAELPQLAHIILDKEYMINGDRAAAGHDIMQCVEIIFARLALSIGRGDMSKPVFNLLKNHIKRLTCVIENTNLNDAQ